MAHFVADDGLTVIYGSVWCSLAHRGVPNRDFHPPQSFRRRSPQPLDHQ